VSVPLDTHTHVHTQITHTSRMTNNDRANDEARCSTAGSRIIPGTKTQIAIK